MSTEATVFVVDDDQAVREGLHLLMESVGLNVESYGSALEFLDHYRSEQRGCMVLDICMPGISGLDLQEQLAARGIDFPIIILTGHGDVPSAVRALQGGAMDFVEKPFSNQVLLNRVQRALRRDAEIRRESAQQNVISERLARLTPRERQVLDMVVAGRANKIVAIDLQISERTVEFHRTRIRNKMQARSLAQLIQMTLSAQRSDSL